ncbi:MAG: ABC transporter substrate-binding protein [Thermoanaerobaculia bacterium]|nr:ABC transporter substrate-binding protein [Thermoanaerobaculia bacterium]
MKDLSRVLLTLVLGLGILGCPAGEKTVLIGAVVPLSGPVEAYGTAVNNGIALAYERAKSGPDLGFVLQLETVDSQGDPATAAKLLKDLYSKGAITVIGGVTSDEAMEMVGVADAADRTLVSPTASSPELTGVSRNFYRIFPSDFEEGTKMGSFAANTLGLKTAVILAAESPYGRGIQGVFKNEFTRHGSEIVEVIEYPQGTNDFSGLIERAVTLEPEAVYLAAYWDDVVAMVKGLHQAGYKGKTLTTAAFATSQAVESAGPAAENVYFTQTVFDLSNPNEPIPSFVEAYRAKYGLDPDLYAAHGYDAMNIVLEALKKNDSTQGSDFWKGMRSIRSYQGTTGSLQFDEKGDVQKYPRVYVIKDAAPVNYDKFVNEARRVLQESLKALEQKQKQLRANP